MESPEKESPTRPVLTVAETAAILGLGYSTVYELVRRGELPSIKIGGSIRIPRKHIEDLIGSAA